MSKEIRNRNIPFYFRATPKEAEIINKRYELSGCTNKGAFFRKMIIKGYLLKLELQEIKDFTIALSRYNNNVNQIAHHLNGAGFIYKQELLEIQKSQEEIKSKMNELIELLGILRQL